jgi:NADH-quinone oxidoreductase subunit I
MTKKGANNSYFGNIIEGIKTSVKGLQLSIRHAKEAIHIKPPHNVQHPDYFEDATGIVTLSYPYESIPVPENGRYQLHNEIDDCIVCDKCAKICPVDCIEIEAIKAPEEIGKTSDGTSKRLYAARFDIDMAKCCYCGLCTTVCPTECLTMTPEYDFSTFDIRDMIFEFSEMTPAEIEAKKQEAEAADAAKKAKKQPAAIEEKPSVSSSEQGIENQPKKLAFKPKPIISKQLLDESEQQPISSEKIANNEDLPPTPTAKPRPVMKKPVMGSEQPSVSSDSSNEETAKPASSAKPRPVMKKPVISNNPSSETDNKQTEEKSETESSQEVKPISVAKPRPIMKKPIIKPNNDENSNE